MNTSPRRKPRLLALWCALLPLTLLGGCGGGGGNGSSLQTPSPTVAPNIAFPVRALRLPGGQLAILNLSLNGNALAGTLRAVDDVTAQSALPAGIYPVTGDFAAPGGFSLSSRGAGAGFSLSGVLPINDDDGSYNFSNGSASGSGVLPARGFVPATSDYVTFGDLQFSDFTASGPAQIADYPFDLAPVTPGGAGAFNTVEMPRIDNGVFLYETRGDAIIQTLLLQGKRIDATNARRNARVSVRFDPTTFSQPQALREGQIFDLQLRSPAANSSHAVTVVVNVGGLNYQSQAGTVKIDSLSSQTVSLTLKDVKVTNSTSFPTNVGNAGGTPNESTISDFVVNGRFSSFGITAFVRPRPLQIGAPN